MKKIFGRVINLLPISAAVAIPFWLYYFFTEGYTEHSDISGFIMGILIVAVVLNYVLFGKVTLWNRDESDNQK